MPNLVKFKIKFELSNLWQVTASSQQLQFHVTNKFPHSLPENSFVANKSVLACRIQDIFDKHIDFWNKLNDFEFLELTIETPKGYNVILPFGSRYESRINKSKNLVKVRIPTKDFKNFVFYEGIIVHNEDFVEHRQAKNGYVVYTKNVRSQMVELVLEVHNKALDFLRNIIGETIYAQSVTVFVVDHNFPFKEDNMWSWGSCVIMKDYENVEHYPNSWYVCNLIHEFGHCYYVWPLIYGDFEVKEGGAEMIKLYLSRELFPEYFNDYEKSNVVNRLERREKYLIAAIKNMALDYLIKKVSKKYTKQEYLNIFGLIQYLIVTWEKRNQKLTFEDLVKFWTPKFLEKQLSCSIDYLKMIFNKAYNSIRRIDNYLTQNFPYFKREVFEKHT